MIYLESSQNVITATKGTPEYTEVMERLEKTNYAHQVEDDEEDKEDGGNKNRLNDSDEQIEVADNSEAGKDIPQLLGL